MVKLLKFYKSIVQGVAFIPLVVSTILTGIALLVTLSPAVSSFSTVVYSGGYFEVRTSETARAVLTSIVSGMISLTVFGFSMMIVVINQAASNYSPKVVETLSSQRSNQYILGVNLGTIIFALIVMMHIDNQEADGGIPELAIFLSMLLAIYCLFLFVRFINNISNSVRINNIIGFIFKKTRKSIARLDDREWIALSADNGKASSWREYKAGHSGYFQLVRTDALIELLEKKNLRLKVVPLPGQYYLQHEPLFQLDKEVEEDIAERIRSEFVTYYGENIGENAVYGFRQLREIAVKALSPGINDPGVAILCVEHLAELLSRSVGRKAEYAIAGGDGHPRIFLKEYDIHALLDMSLLPILTYGRRDDAVLNALLSSVYQLAQNEKAGPLRRHLEKLADAIICAADESVRGEIQRTLLASRVDEIRKTGYLDFRAELRKLPDASPDH